MNRKAPHAMPRLLPFSPVAVLCAGWLLTASGPTHAQDATAPAVSFQKHVAPIFVKRCVVCHNARTAKGRYNMDSYAAIMKGGNQIEVVPHKADDSYLFTQVLDGDMPKDTEPLAKDDIALIRQWIAGGAQLDEGVNPQARLASIIPKAPYPAAPEKYRTPMPVVALAFNPAGTVLASSGSHEVLLWNAADGKLLRRIPNVAELIYDLEFSPDGTLFAVAAGTPGQQDEVKLFSAADGKLVRDLVATNDSALAVAFSPDGKRLAVASADKTLRVFGLDTGARELSIDVQDWALDVAWSSDGTKLASASRDKGAKIFDAQTGRLLTTFEGHAEAVLAVQFSPDGSQVVSAGRDRSIRIWGIADARQTRQITGFDQEIGSLLVTADRRIFSSSGKLVHEHTFDGGEPVRTFAGLAAPLHSLAFNPATKTLAAGLRNGEIGIWKTDDTTNVLTFVAAPGYTRPASPAK